MTRPVLPRRVDDRLVDGMEGALREGRERPYLLDLVAEQLDAQRLPARARKDVDQPSPDRDVTSILDPLDPFVSGEGQRFDETVQSRARTRRDADGVGASLDAAARPRRAPGPRRRRDRPRRAPRARAPARRRDAVVARDPIRAPRRGSGGAQREPESTYQATASAVSRASSSSARRQTSGRSRAPCSVASRSGSTASDTRAAAGKSSTNTRKRSLEASSATSPASGEGGWSMRLAGNASRAVIVTSRPSPPVPLTNHPQGHPDAPLGTLSGKVCHVVHARSRIDTNAACARARLGGRHD